MTLIEEIARSDMMRTLAGEVTDAPPCWIMRQAGRYLPEYRATRAQAGSFLDLCFNPELATEVTLQPLRRFDLQAAILFSDILVIPWALGQHLEFQEGEGPVLKPVTTGAEIADLKYDGLISRLEPVLEAVGRIRAGLPSNVPLIGFAGAPWTLATYAIAGRGTKDQAPAKTLMLQDPAAFDALIDLYENCCFDFLDAQIKAGANLVKLFDSWAGSLPPVLLDRACTQPLKRIVARLRTAHPDVPVIVFPRGIGPRYPAFIEEVRPTATAVDQNISMSWIREAAPSGSILQGNLDPVYLTAPKETLLTELRRVRDDYAGHPHVFNLGHGVTPDSQIENVATVIDFVRGKIS